MADDTTETQMPTPDPALKRLDRFVGTWKMEGRLVGSDEETITGEATYRWLPGGFFLEQKVTLNFVGLKIQSQELIGTTPRPTPSPRTSTRTWRRRRSCIGGRSMGTP
jgi:hypothetical protein